MSIENSKLAETSILHKQHASLWLSYNLFRQQSLIRFLVHIAILFSVLSVALLATPSFPDATLAVPALGILTNRFAVKMDSPISRHASQDAKINSKR